VPYGERRCRVDGIEICEPYIGPLQRQIYDEILVGDACDVLRRLNRRYDLIFAIDLVEYMARDRGKELATLSMAESL